MSRSHERTIIPMWIGFILMFMIPIPSGLRIWAAQAGADVVPTPKPGLPSIEEYATIESYCKGFPVYSFSNINYVYGVSPDLYPGAVMQERNTNPIEKVPPKKSWEIKHNYAGSQYEMTVRTAWNESQPFLPIHLIDGDRDTVWCSWGSPVYHGGDIPDWHPEWIRIDLPAETAVAAVALVCSKNFPKPGFGNALPRELEVKLSRDAWHWESVYKTKNFVGDKSGTTVIKFDPRPAKQIWILADNFPMTPGAGNVFSIGELEVRDPAGSNLALVSRGAGVTVSSTDFGMLGDRFSQDALWGPVQYDLGNKWVRVGPEVGTFTWNYVEMEKGRLQIDRRADESITECVRNGIKVIMNLDYKGNWRYLNPPRKLNWREARYREINENWADYAGQVTDSPEMFKGYLRFVDYMARHFKDRVAYFEIGNEWSQPGIRGMDVDQYIGRIFNPTYEAIKAAAPEAKIMLGSPDAFRAKEIAACLRKPGVASKIDAIGWHPSGWLGREYVEAVRAFKKQCEALGFKGRYFATEIYARAGYPPGPVAQYGLGSEMQMAKTYARTLTLHGGLDMEAGPCLPHFTGIPIAQCLTRWTWPVSTLIPVMPSASYYVWRNIATVTDDFYPADFPVALLTSKKEDMLDFTFQSGNQKKKMIAVWTMAGGVDAIVEEKADVLLPGFQAGRAWVFDVFNGTRQELNLTSTGDGTLFKNLLIKDYPMFIRFN